MISYSVERFHTLAAIYLNRLHSVFSCGFFSVFSFLRKKNKMAAMAVSAAVLANVTAAAPLKEFQGLKASTSFSKVQSVVHFLQPSYFASALSNS